jgi:predicted Kef-type K+ transport protein
VSAFSLPLLPTHHVRSLVTLRIPLLTVFIVEVSVIPSITGCYQTSGSDELFVPFVLLFALELGMSS